jgi:hypothetical protein
MLSLARERLDDHFSEWKRAVPRTSDRNSCGRLEAQERPMPFLPNLFVCLENACNSRTVARADSEQCSVGQLVEK